MQEIRMNTIIDLVTDTSLIAYKTKDGQIMKLQKTGKDQWIFANISSTVGYLGVNNTHDWEYRNFTNPALAVKSIMIKFEDVRIFVFESFSEFVKYLI